MIIVRAKAFVFLKMPLEDHNVKYMYVKVCVNGLQFDNSDNTQIIDDKLPVAFPAMFFRNCNDHLQHGRDTHWSIKNNTY